jgi:ATP-binding cassette subfamily B protein
MVWRASATLTAALAVLTLAAAIVPPAIAWVGKAIVDAGVAKRPHETLTWVMVELALVAMQALMQRALALTSQILGMRLGIVINVAILERAVALDLTAFEDSEFYDRMTRARREASSRPVQLVREAFALAQSVLTLAGYALVLARFSPWVILVLVVSTIPATVAEMRAARHTFQLRNRRSQEWRRLTYFEYVLTNDEHAKEVKLFGLGPPLLERYRALSEQLFSEDRRVAVRRTLGQTLSLAATLAFYGAYAVMALAAASGRVTLGSLTLYVVAFRQGQQAFQAVLGAMGSIYEQNLYMTNLFEFLDGPTEPVSDPKWTSAALESPIAGAAPAGNAGLVFEHVSYRYPGKDEWAVRDVSLVIPAGRSVALVGENGAGKTTLVKLATRLYTPTSGRILLDGRDLREWPESLLRARFGVVFQDFAQYQLTVRDNVGLGSAAHLDDDARINRAIALGGANDLLAFLPKGRETLLGNWFKGGTELSGGQWQKVALARAFMREEADILVLDEPTAALDAEAEHRVFGRFRALARGRTTIIVSHRFATVRMADRIVVLDRGAIVEEGTHAELLDRGGQYARLFELQADAYR